MSPYLGRGVAVLLGFGLAVVSCTADQEQLNEVGPTSPVRMVSAELPPEEVQRLRQQAPERDAQVRAELAALREHTWAGSYRTRSRWPEVLNISPEAGFTPYYGSYCGTCAGWQAFGKVRPASDVEIALETEVGYDLPEAIGPMLHLVRWGDLLFAVTPDRMELFCSEASDGCSFPRVPFRYLGRDPAFDYREAPRPIDWPLVPAQYERLLAREPIACKVEALEGWRARSSVGDQPAFDVLYSIDAGARLGVEVGMRFFVEGDAWPHSRGRVEEVGWDSAKVAFIAS